MKLWKCTADLVFVVASKEQPTWAVVERLARKEAMDNGLADAWVIGEIKSADELPVEWNEDQCPQSDETRETIGEILESQTKEPQ